jgi:hypothetical protein
MGIPATQSDLLALERAGLAYRVGPRATGHGLENCQTVALELVNARGEVVHTVTAPEDTPPLQLLRRAMQEYRVSAGGSPRPSVVPNADAPAVNTGTWPASIRP